MPDENTFKSAFADANCPKETRSYTLAHLKTKKILRKHSFCELMPYICHNTEKAILFI